MAVSFLKTMHYMVGIGLNGMGPSKTRVCSKGTWCASLDHV